MSQNSNMDMPTDNSEHPLLAAFSRMHKQLMATAQKILSNSDDAEDALQDAFVRLWSSTSIFKSEQDASAMLHVTTKHISLNTVRNRKQNIDIDSYTSSKELSTFSSEEIYTKKETFSAVEKIINQNLTPLQQKIIQLREYEGRSFEDIANTLDMQPAAVRMQLSRARKTIRECYQKYSND